MHRVLITGASGFVGRNLIDFLLRETEYDIISMYRTASNIHSESNDRLKKVYHDLREPITEEISFEIGKIDYIIHLAASTSTEKSLANPINFVLNNVVGTANLLEYSRHYARDLKQLLYLSSAEIYGPSIAGTIFKESNIPNPLSPYAATKVAAQEICMSYKNIYKIPVVIGYAMNAFGPHQSSQKFIPQTIQKVLKGKRVQIHLSSGGVVPHRRNYLHIYDLCDAILFLSHNGISGEKYNIAAAEESDNLKLAQMIADLLGKELKYELVDREINSLALPRLDGEKLRKLGWHQKKTLRDGIKELIEWTM
jgi:dTDP-glucose 4,6-dehydratase